jgi:hypothetical protein
MAQNGAEMNREERVNINAMILDMACDNGMLHRGTTQVAVLRNGWRALEADGVLTEDVYALEQWLGTLTAEEKETLVGGEEEEMAALMALAPVNGAGHNVALLVDDIYDALCEHDKPPLDEEAGQ